MFNQDYSWAIYSGGIVGLIILILLILNHIKNLNKEIKENKNKNRNRFIITILYLLIISIIGGSGYLFYITFLQNNRPVVSIPLSNINL
jgi:uncharacterized membrane protein